MCIKFDATAENFHDSPQCIAMAQSLSFRLEAVALSCRIFSFSRQYHPIIHFTLNVQCTHSISSGIIYVTLCTSSACSGALSSWAQFVSNPKAIAPPPGELGRHEHFHISTLALTKHPWFLKTMTNSFQISISEVYFSKTHFYKVFF